MTGVGCGVEGAATVGASAKTEAEGSAADEVDRREREVEALLAMFERGEIAVEVRPLALPVAPLEPDRRVTAFCALVFAVRAWAGLPEEAPMSARWVGRYVGLPPMTVSRSLRRLCEAEAIERMGRWGRLGTFAYRPWRLAAKEVVAAAPAFAGRVEADDAGSVDERQEVGDDVAVLGAVADDRRGVLEVDGGRGAVDADAGGGAVARHATNHKRAGGRCAIFDEGG